MAVLSRWWKQMVLITVLATLVALGLALLLPKKYYATATALPASSMATDKAAIFNTNIEQLYSSLGTSDDLDRMIGTAHLDTLYIAAVNESNLVAHYGFSTGPDGVEQAIRKLKKNTSISKSEWGELKLKVWDVDRFYAARLANTLLQKLQQLHQSLQNKSNQLILQQLKSVQQTMPQTDAMLPDSATPAKESEAGPLHVYDKLIREYNLMVTANPPVLLVVENARPPLYPDNSAKQASVLAAAFAAALFSFLLALYLEGKKARP